MFGRLEIKHIIMADTIFLQIILKFILQIIFDGNGFSLNINQYSDLKPKLMKMHFRRCLHIYKSNLI